MKCNIDLILKRRSIRKYEDKEVADDLIKCLLQAAMSAPSAVNQQPWHFFVIKNRGILNELAEIHSGFHNLRGSPLAILVCGEPGAAKLEFYWEQDCSAASQNILPAAAALGLGAVWQGINPRGGSDSDEIRRIVKLPENLKPFSLISIGYPAEFPKPSDRFNEARVHYVK
jgi:nitroreductase